MQTTPDTPLNRTAAIMAAADGATKGACRLCYDTRSCYTFFFSFFFLKFSLTPYVK